MSLTGGGRMTGGAPAPHLTGSADTSWSLGISRKTVYLQHLIGPHLKVCGYRGCQARRGLRLACTASLERSPPHSLRSQAGAGEETSAPYHRPPASIAGRQPTRLPGKPPATRGRKLHWGTHVRPAQKAKPTDTVERRIGRKPMRTSGARNKRLVRNRRAPTPVLQLTPGCFSQWNSRNERSK